MKIECSTELSFLLSVCLNLPDSQTAPDRIDWERTLQLAARHAVFPLFFHRLSGYKNVPEKILTVAKEKSREGAKQSLFLSTRMLEIHSGLHAKGVSAFPLKGPLWAWTYYENPGLRSFGDLDFFIPKESLPKGIAAMLEWGFAMDPFRKYLLSREGVVDDFLEADNQLLFIPGDEKRDLTAVELHWQVMYARFGAFFTWQELMSTKTIYTIGNREIEAPGPEFQLLLMIIHHGLIEQWAQIKFVADLVFFLRLESEGLDWDLVWGKAKEKGMTGVLLTGLQLARELDGRIVLEVPPFSHSVQTSYDKTILIWEKGRKEVTTQSFRMFFYNLRYRDRWGDRLTVLYGHFKFLMKWKLHVAKLKWYQMQKR